MVQALRLPGSCELISAVRLNAKLKSHNEGGVASFAIATRVMVEFGQGPVEAFKLDLSRKAPRLLGENAALVTAQLAGAADIENLE